MNVTYRCPDCEQTVRSQVDTAAAKLPCPACNTALQVPEGAIRDGHLHRCLVCPSTDLFIRKDFPQRLGVTIVVLGFFISCVFWARHEIYLTFAALFATAFIDLLLYVTMGECLNCYRCGAQYRSLESLSGHQAFNLETHERYRQQAARLAQTTTQPPAQPGGRAIPGQSPGLTDHAAKG